MKEHGPHTTRLLNVKAIFETVLNSEKARNRSKLSLVIYHSFLAILCIFTIYQLYIYTIYGDESEDRSSDNQIRDRDSIIITPSDHSTPLSA